jgi:hypothetical protein
MAAIVPDPNDWYLVKNVLSPELAKSAFADLRNEVDWQVMNHRGNEVPRLVAVQGEVEPDGRYGAAHDRCLVNKYIIRLNL